MLLIAKVNSPIERSFIYQFTPRSTATVVLVAGWPFDTLRELVRRVEANSPFRDVLLSCAQWSERGFPWSEYRALKYSILLCEQVGVAREDHFVQHTPPFH